MSEKVIQTKIRSGNKKLSGDKIKTGPCVFPYTYKGEIYNECFKGKYGDWCATEVDKDTQKMKKYAFCDYKKKNQHHQQPRRKLPRRNQPRRKQPRRNQPRRKQPRRNLLRRRHRHQHQLPKRNQLKRAHRHKAPFPPKKHLLRKKEKSIRSNQETHYKV